jgi:hypothetical protein
MVNLVQLSSYPHLVRAHVFWVGIWADRRTHYGRLEQGKFVEFLDGEELGAARTVLGRVDQDEAPIEAKPLVGKLDG